MMTDADPRVKDLQSLAWSLQSLSNKPGGRVPESAKREAYKVTSKAIDLCSNAPYIAEEDFVRSAEVFRKEIEAKKVWLKEVEDAEIEKLQGKCFAGDGSGGYTKIDKGSTRAAGNVNGGSAGELLAQLKTTERTDAELVRALTAKEVVARCQDDPEALWLSDLGLKDTDMDALTEGLRKGGHRLTSLDLSHNAIADAGVQKLVTALAGGACPKLSELWLAGNSFGPLGTQMLRGGLGALRRNLALHLETAAAGGATAGDGGRGEERRRPASAEARETSAASEVGPTASGEVERGSGAARPAEAGARQAPAAAAEVSGATAAAEGAGRPPPAAAAAAAAVVAAGSSPAADTGGGGVDVVGSAGAAVEVAVEEGAEGRLARASVSLPDGVSSVRDLDLCVNERRLLVTLSSTGASVADVALPFAVDPESAQAAFSKRRRALTVAVREKK